MRKMRLVLVMVLAMALAVPMAAHAAADLSVTGDTTIRLAYGQNQDEKYELLANWRTRAYLDMRVNKGNVTGYARYRLRSTGFVPHYGAGDNYDTNLNLYDAYIDAKGAWIPGTPEVTTRVGRFESRRMNDWVADFKRRAAARVTGLALGPVNIDLYHAWNSRNPSSTNVSNPSKTTESVSAIIGKANIDIVELKGAYVVIADRSDAAKYENTADYAVGVAVKPVSGIEIGADYAHHGANEANAWKVSGKLATVPNMTISAATWDVEDSFRPTYGHPTKTENLAMDRNWVEQPTAYEDPFIGKGFSIGVETNQAGLPIKAKYTSGSIFGAGPNLPGGNATFAGRDMSIIGVGTSIANIKLDFAYTSIENVEPYLDLKATHKLKGLPVGGDIDLTAVVRMQKDEDSKFATDAVWKAPNGLTLGLHYANYDRRQDWNHNYSNDNLAEGINLGKAGEADGFAITAGYQLTF